MLGVGSLEIMPQIAEDHSSIASKHNNEESWGVCDDSINSLHQEVTSKPTQKEIVPKLQLQ